MWEYDVHLLERRMGEALALKCVASEFGLRVDRRMSVAWERVFLTWLGLDGVDHDAIDGGAV